MLAHLQAEQDLPSVCFTSADLLITALEPAARRSNEAPPSRSLLPLWVLFVISISTSPCFVLTPSQILFVLLCRSATDRVKQKRLFLLLVRLKSARGSGGLWCFHTEQKARNDVVELRRPLRVLRV